MMNAEAAAIEVDQLRKTYRDGLIRRRSLEALKGVSLRVEPGEIFGLLGPNGAGKTTFVKVLLGIARKTSGSALLLGRPAGSRLSRKRIGYLPENLRIPPHHNALSALQLHGQLSGLSRARIRSRGGAMLEMVGLADRAKDAVRKYSKGMLQRLGLAIALLHDPELVFMDEPTDGLDPIGRTQVRQVLQELKHKGKTIFLNSHLLQEVEMVCDRVAILADGTLRRVGTVDELIPRRTEGIELDLELSGQRQAIESALAGWKVTRVQYPDSGLCHARVRQENQSQVDQCVDSLRQQDVSIISLSRRRLSLEDAFMEILGQNVETP